MARCSDPTPEPGPVTALDLGDFGKATEPATLEAYASAFTSNFDTWLPILDGSYVALELELALDVTGVLDSSLGALSGAGIPIAWNASIPLLLQTIQGWAPLGANVADLENSLPPEATAPSRLIVTWDRRKIPLNIRGVPLNP